MLPAVFQLKAGTAKMAGHPNHNILILDKKPNKKHIRPFTIYFSVGVCVCGCVWVCVGVGVCVCVCGVTYERAGSLFVSQIVVVVVAAV